MELLTTIAIVALTSSCVVTEFSSSSNKMLNKEGDRSSIVDIEIKEPDNRHKGNLPDIIILTITSENDKIGILLSRVKRKVPDPVLLVMTLKGLFVDHLQETKIRKEFFRSRDKAASFSIAYGQGNLLEIHGHFIHNGSFHSVSPVHGVGAISKQTFSINRHQADRKVKDKNDKILSVKRDHRKLITQKRPHRITKLKIPLDFSMDALNFSDPEVRNPRPVNLQHKRHKRDHSNSGRKQNFYVEYVIVTDYQNYKNWHEETDGLNLTTVQRDRLTKYSMLQFYQHVVHGIDTIYQSLNGETKQLEIILTGVIFVNVSGYATWTENSKTCSFCDTVDDQKALYDFAVWRRETLSKVLQHDHAALFTGYDMYFVAMESPRTVGLSYLGSMCLNGSVSIVEEKRNALTTHIAAHELGHNFGAYHDGGETTGACDVQDRFLMVPNISGFDDPAKASNPWTFSPCSKMDIYDNFNYLDQTAKNCLTNKPSIPKTIPRTEAGILYSADLQCQLQFGVRSSVCREYHKDDWSGMCYSMACSVPGSNNCILIFPHRGTPCGDKKWCHRGQCEEHDEAPIGDDLCPLGDDPHYNCVLSSCQDENAVYNTDDIKKGLCCHTCRNNTITTAESPNVTSSLQSWTSSHITTITNVTMTTTAEPANVTSTVHSWTRSKHTTTITNVTMTTPAEPTNVTSTVHPWTSNHTTISSNVTMTTRGKIANATTSTVQPWIGNDTTRIFLNITHSSTTVNLSSSLTTVTKATTSRLNPTNNKTVETSTVKSSIRGNKSTTTQGLSKLFSSTDTSVTSSTITSQPITVSAATTSLSTNITNEDLSVNMTPSSGPSSESPYSNSTNMATISTHNTSTGTTESHPTNLDQKQQNTTKTSSYITTQSISPITTQSTSPITSQTTFPITTQSTSPITSQSTFPITTQSTSTRNVLTDIFSTYNVDSISTVEEKSKLPHTTATDDSHNNVLSSANFISIPTTLLTSILTTMHFVKFW